MQNIIAKCTEKVTLLEEEKNNSQKLTYNKYKEIIKSKAYITIITKENYIDELFEIIILKPPIKFKNSLISGIKWNNKELQIKKPFISYKNKFLKGTVINKK